MNGVIGRLRAALDEISDENLRGLPLFLTAVGWAYSNGQGNPVLVELARTESRASTKVTGCGLRYWRTCKHKLAMSFIGSGSSESLQRSFVTALREIHKRAPSSLDEWDAYVDAVLELPVRKIQETSAADRTVGPNVHLVMMPRGNDDVQTAETMFFAANEHLAPLPQKSALAGSFVNAAITGWFIGRTSIHAPSYFVSSIPQTISTGRTVVRIHGAQPEGQVMHLYKAVSRIRSSAL